jgi:hypothetical protein
MDSVGNAFMYTMNWNPSYSYSKLPDGYKFDSLPEHWKKLLHKVEPEEKGIPQFRNIYVSNVVVKHARKAINGNGLASSPLDGFHFDKIEINADTAGEVGYAKNWTWKDVSIISKDNKTVAVTNSTAVKL